MPLKQSGKKDKDGCFVKHQLFTHLHTIAGSLSSLSALHIGIASKIASQRSSLTETMGDSSWTKEERETGEQQHQKNKVVQQVLVVHLVEVHCLLLD